MERSAVVIVRALRLPDGQHPAAQPLTQLDEAAGDMTMVGHDSPAFVKYAYVQPHKHEAHSPVRAWPAKASYLVRPTLPELYFRVTDVTCMRRYLWHAHSGVLLSAEDLSPTAMNQAPSMYVVDAFADGSTTVETLTWGRAAGAGLSREHAPSTPTTVRVLGRLTTITKLLQDMPSLTAAAIRRAQRHETSGGACVVTHCPHRDLLTYACGCSGARAACGACAAELEHRCPMCRQHMHILDE
jgi:hypothetical protein